MARAEAVPGLVLARAGRDTAGLARALVGSPEVGVAGQKGACRPPRPLVQVNPTSAQTEAAQPNRNNLPIPRQPGPRNLHHSRISPP